MGIKDLNSFIKLKVPHSITERQFNYYRGKSIAIDTSIFLYKFIYKNDRYLEGFFQQIYRLMSHGITPVYVFDGIPSTQKKNVINNRREKKNVLKSKTDILRGKLSDPSLDGLSKLEIQGEINKLNKKLIYITNKHINDLKYMFELMNIQYIQATGEADAYCSALFKDGVVDLCLSDDMDLLASGCRKLLRNFNVSSNSIWEYDLDIILDTLDLTQDQWIDFCILCGCDYTSRIRGIGSKYAYKLIKDYGNIDTIMRTIFSDNIPYNFNYKIARDIFKNCNYYDYSDVVNRIEHIYGDQLEKLKYFLRENTNLSDYLLNDRLRHIYNNVPIRKLIL